MRRVAALALTVLLSACISPATQMRVGTRVATEELFANRGDLRGWIEQEIRAGHSARAFYGLELLKTRRYAGQRLAAESVDTAVAAAHRDLRPVFAEAFGDGAQGAAEGSLVASRGLQRVAESHGATFRAYDAAADALFWDDLRLFETRIEELVPYGHALAYSFAVTSTQEARALLGPRDLLVSFFVAGESVYLFVVRPRGRTTIMRLPASASQLRALAATLLDQLRHPPSPSEPRAWEFTSAALYDALFAGAPLAGAQTIFVVPDDFLSNVPYALLLQPGANGTRAPILEGARVTYLPSATVYRRLMMREILNEPPKLLAVGNPTFSVPLPGLAASEQEAQAVAGVFDEAMLLTGEAASELKITNSMTTHNVLHFATHGVLLDDRVPGASSLMVAAGDTTDGFLSAAEIGGLDLSGVYLAVLSACETSVSSTAGESLDVGSLTGAFMAAGTPTVLGSLWPVSDTSTSALLVRFYTEFLALGAGDALRQAQLALRASPGMAHPYYWGAFVLYGWDK